MTTWVGIDPGGKHCFGIALLNESITTICVSCVDEAIAVLKKHLQGKPAGIGIDAPLWWSSGFSGDRLADQWLRKTYSIPSGTVQTANSLRGAALVQAAMFVYQARLLFPGVKVTETHPKALLRAIYKRDWNQFSAKHQVAPEVASIHERDAIIGAVAAREGFSGRWRHDLSLARHPSEQDPSEYWLAPVHYFWPE